MLSEVELTVPADVFDAIGEQAMRTPNLMATAVKRTVRARRRIILRRLRDEPGQPKYPIRWASARQRRAFFATNGFGRGIPTVRTGKLLRGWQVDSTINTRGGSITARNDVPYMQFVQGENQQPMHIDTGWVYAPKVLVEEEEHLEEALIETWYTISDPFAGVNS